MVLEVLVDIKRVEVLRVEPREQHVDDERDVNLLLAPAREVEVGELLVLDALLNVLIVEVKVVDVVVGAVPLVVVGDDRLERGLLALRVVAVVLLLLREVLLDLLDVLVALCRRGKNRSDLEGYEVGVC